jgi:hypothetical protein
MFDHAAAVHLTYKATRICKHARPNQEDLAYWPDKYTFAYAQDADSGVEYMYNRNLGLGAGGTDIPPYGPYGLDRVTPPPDPYPEESETPVPTPNPEPIPVPTPIPTPTVIDYTSVLKEIAAASTRIADVLERVAKKFGV